jgi:hypothetical protein
MSKKIIDYLIAQATSFLLVFFSPFSLWGEKAAGVAL